MTLPSLAIRTLITVAALLLPAVLPGVSGAWAKELSVIGISVSSLANPFFVAIAREVEARARQINPNVRVITVASDYDVSRQIGQIDRLIASGVDLIQLVAADAVAIESAVRRAQAAGIPVVAMDVRANAADATITTDNVQAGETACRYLADRLKGRGEVVIVNGPQVSSVIDRVSGCKSVLAAFPGIRLLSDEQNGEATPGGGRAAMRDLLARFPRIDGVFAINDPTAIGANLAARQAGRHNLVIASVDGSPEIEQALKGDSQIAASASQDPYLMAQKALEIGAALVRGERLDRTLILMPSSLVTRETVGAYKGWISMERGERSW